MKRRTLSALRTLSLPASLIVYPKSAVSTMLLSDITTELRSLLSKIRE